MSEPDLLEKGGGWEETKRSTPGGHERREMVVTVDERGGNRHVLEWSVEDLREGKGRKKTRILSKLAGRVETGNLMAILGPSVPAKSSLIDCLSLRNRSFIGAVHLDGKSADSEYFTKTAVVHQADMLFGFLTVREHLIFHAIARMSDRRSHAQLERRVKQVMQELELTKCADKMIGGTGALFPIKGISAGERTRLTIATEMLLSPQVIFLDECTAGLDTLMAESVIRSLSSVASRGTAVIASLHSPTSAMARYFTHASVLTKDGRLAFQGPYAEVGNYLVEELGMHVPDHFSTLEFFLSLVSGQGTVVRSAGNWYGEGNGAKAITKRMDALVMAFAHSDLKIIRPLPSENAHRMMYTSVPRLRVSWLTLVALNMWRQLIIVRRDIVSFAFGCTFKVVIGLVLGMLFFDAANSQWRNVVGLLYVVAASLFFISSVPLIFLFPREWPKVVTENLSGANTIGPYVISTVLTGAPYFLGDVLMATIVFSMAGFGYGLIRYLLFLTAVLLTSFAGGSIGLWLGSVSRNPLVGLTVSPSVYYPTITFSGVLYMRSAVPDYLKWMQTASIVNHSFYVLVGYQTEVVSDKGKALTLAFCGVDPALAWKHIWALLVITAFTYVLTYLNLRLHLQYYKRGI